jgi:hypothetical protein
MGHLLYKRDALGITSRGFTLNETAGTQAIPGQDVSKVFEWQADREATRAVVDVVMRPAVLDELPAPYRSPAWLLRFVMVAIGCVITLFDRARLIQRAKGESDVVNSHPTDRTRFLAASIIAQERNRSPVSGGAELRLTSSDAHWAMYGAVIDIAIANRPGARELWPFPVNWRPNPDSMRDSDVEGILHFRDWSEGPFDPFENVMLHTDADAYVGSLLFHMGAVIDPFGTPGEDAFLNEAHKIALRQVPQLSYGAFVNIFRGWVTEISGIVQSHDSWVWDLLAKYRDARWNG